MDSITKFGILVFVQNLFSIDMFLVLQLRVFYSVLFCLSLSLKSRVEMSSSKWKFIFEDGSWIQLIPIIFYRLKFQLNVKLFRSFVKFVHLRIYYWSDDLHSGLFFPWQGSSTIVYKSAQLFQYWGIKNSISVWKYS